MVAVAVVSIAIIDAMGFEARFPPGIRALANAPALSREQRHHECFLELKQETTFADSCVEAKRPLVLTWGDSTIAAGMIGWAMAHQILAELALAGGRAPEALRELDKGGLRGPHARTWERAYSSPFFSQSRGRFLRARAAVDSKQDDEALRWYGSLWMANAFDLAYLGPAQLKEAEMFDRRGESDRALQGYKRVAELWKEADPELQATVDQVRRRIAELEAGAAK